MLQIEFRNAIDDDADHDQHRHAPKQRPQQSAARNTLLEPPAEGEGKAGAGAEQEGGGDHIDRAHAVPFGMIQPAIAAGPVARKQVQHHADHREAAQQIERLPTRRTLRCHQISQSEMLTFSGDTEKLISSWARSCAAMPGRVP